MNKDCVACEDACEWISLNGDGDVICQHGTMLCAECATAMVCDSEEESDE